MIHLLWPLTPLFIFCPMICYCFVLHLTNLGIEIYIFKSINDIIQLLFYIYFLGGLSLQGNPWLCSCQNTWLGTWLRRWMRETLQLHASIIDRNHHIQTMVRTIKCQVPALPVDRWYSSSAVSVSAHDMKMAATAASSGHSSYNKDGSGQHNNNNNNPVSTSVSARNLRPLVELSEAETSSWSCSALKRGRNSASAIKNVSEVIVLSLLCVFCLLKNAVIS